MRLLVAIPLLVLCGCSPEQPEEQPIAATPPRRPSLVAVKRSPVSELKLPAGKPVRVLFIGNSLTFSNDLPAVVQSIAASLKVRLEYDACTMGGANLEDHWRHGKCKQMLDGSKWDYVVLQQGPSSQPPGRADLLKWAASWNTEIRKHGAKPALYMVWPFKDQKDGFQQVHDSYSSAATEVNGLFLPAGDAWYRLIKSKSNIALYSPDNLHPTREGTVLAALVIAGKLTGKSLKKVANRLLVASGGAVELPETMMKELLTAASQTLTARHSPFTE